MLRFLAGCAVVILFLGAIVVGGALLIGWRLARDEAPGRARETFFVGDEARYWCLDLKPDDKGLAALFARFDEINDATRRKMFRGTFLESFPLPHRRARLDDVAPLTLELALSTRGEPSGLPLPSGWAARGTFSRGLFKVRAGLKLMRYLVSRDPAKGGTFDVGGLTVTELHDEDAQLAIATVGNRVIATSGASRMRSVLQPSAAPQSARLTELRALREKVSIDGEDGWGFVAPMRLGGLSKPIAIGGATAAFDLNERDELVFRVIVLDAGSIDEENAFRGSREDCTVVASALLPGVPVGAIEIDGEGATRGDHPGIAFSGRISGVSTHLAELIGRATELRTRGRWGTPSATPPPPSPPPSGDPRSETPSAPTREGIPTPGR